MKGLIELDEYLDLSDLDSVNKEFEEVIGSLRDYWRMFYSDTRETDEDGNLLKDNPNVHMISLSKLDEDLVNDNWDRYFLLEYLQCSQETNLDFQNGQYLPRMVTR